MEPIPRMRYQRRENLLEKAELPDSLICNICLDLVYDPVQCDKCKSLSCRRCAVKWKTSKNSCPKRCSKPWKITRRENQPLQLVCPYSQECGPFTISGWTKHIEVCAKAPEQIRGENQRKANYECRKGHKLKFWVQRLNSYNKLTCCMCKEVAPCRSYCSTCDESYCEDCRGTPCSQQTCPYGHKYRVIPAAEVRCSFCDYCGFNFKNIPDTDLIVDDICMFGGCKHCFQKLPAKIENPLKICPRDTCNLNHPQKDLVFLKQFKKGVCDNCQEELVLTRQCKTCSRMYCRCCKGLELGQNYCSKGHELQLKGQQESPPPKKAVESRCFNCLKENAEVMDKTCGFSVCLPCHKSIQFQNLFKFGFLRCCVEYFTVRSKPLEKETCVKCKAKTFCSLMCISCGEWTCAKCQPLPQPEKDYAGHPFLEDPEQKYCFICHELKPVKTCFLCEISICHGCQQMVSKGSMA